MRCYHLFIVDTIAESLNLIQMSIKMKSIQMKINHHDGELLGFYKNVHIKTQTGCSSNLYIARNKEFQIYLTKTVLKRTSNAIFNMKKVDLDEWSLSR